MPGQPRLPAVPAPLHQRRRAGSDHRRPGGLLAVITAVVRRPGWAGQLIAQARAAGLVYVQHFVAVHALFGEDRLLSLPVPHPAAQAAASPADTRHLPVHTDLLLFAQPGGPRHD